MKILKKDLMDYLRGVPRKRWHTIFAREEKPSELDRELAEKLNSLGY